MQSELSNIYSQIKSNKSSYFIRVCLVISLVINVLLLIAILTMFPLKEVKPVYVAFSEEKDVVFKVLKMPLPKKQRLLVLRQLVREYVANRHKFDGITEYHRFRRVVSMSSKEVVERFKDEYNRIKNESTFDTREINILADTVIDEARNVHEVHFETIDTLNGEEFRNNWIVSIKYSFGKFKVKGENELLNPLGFRVIKYHQSKTKLTKEQINEIF